MSQIDKNSTQKLRDGRLHLYKQNDSKNWLWRTFLNGKYVVRTTKTDNLAVAKSTAENEYDKLRFQCVAPDGTLAHSWEECERGLLSHLGQDDSVRPSRIKNYGVKLGVLRKYFLNLPIHTIKTKTIEDYVSSRRDSHKNRYSESIANKTLRSDFYVLRQVLKYAKREQFIQNLPDFPKLTVIPRPGGWFTFEEMVSLIGFMKNWVKDSTIPEEIKLRRYTVQYIHWLVHTGMRVDEALTVRFADVHVKKDPSGNRKEDYLFVTIRGGKLAHLKAPSDAAGSSLAVRAFERLQELTPEASPKDLLFPINPRQKVRELLQHAGLLFDSHGQSRTAKNFRHTYIMSRLKLGNDPFLIAKNCRTSVKMIEQHYGSHMTVRMRREELTSLVKRPNQLEAVK